MSLTLERLETRDAPSGLTLDLQTWNRVNNGGGWNYAPGKVSLYDTVADAQTLWMGDALERNAYLHDLYQFRPASPVPDFHDVPRQIAPATVDHAFAAPVVAAVTPPAGFAPYVYVGH